MTPPPDAARQLAALLQEARGLSYCETCDFVGEWAPHYKAHRTHIGHDVLRSLGDVRLEVAQATVVLAEWLASRGVTVGPADGGPELGRCDDEQTPHEQYETCRNWKATVAAARRASPPGMP
jgi:hypothetical protein